VCWFGEQKTEKIPLQLIQMISFGFSFVLRRSSNSFLKSSFGGRKYSPRKIPPQDVKVQRVQSFINFCCFRVKEIQSKNSIGLGENPTSNSFSMRFFLL
jgi:hypothetical protein